MQEQHDLLPVGSQVPLRAHDERRGEQLHLLDRHVAVHPVRAWPRLEVVGPGFARCEQGHGHVRHAVLHVRRNLTVPMDHRADVEVVCQVDPETLAGVEHQSLTAGTSKAEYSGRTTVDLERAACSGQGGGGQRLRGGKTGHLCRTNGGSTCGDKAAS